MPYATTKEHWKELMKLKNNTPMNPQQKITDLEKRQEEIAKELAELKKEMKPQSINEIVAKWSKNECSDFYYARDKRDKIHSIRDMIAVADYLNGDWKPDWKNDKECKFFLVFNDSPNDSNDRIDVNFYYRSKRSFCYFKSEELAKQAISILGEEKIKLALS